MQRFALLAGVVFATDEITCKVPWLENGRWLDCTPEYTKKLGEQCTWAKNFGVECTYPDGPIKCNDEGKFEADGKGKQLCRSIPHPQDNRGCARFDFLVGGADSAKGESCKTQEGCTWNGERQWCEFACRGKFGCGVELHRLNEQCQLNCPLLKAEGTEWSDECAPWQAGCTCIQDTETADCASWCAVTNTNEFMHIKPRKASNKDEPLEPPNTAAMNSEFVGLKTVGAALAMTNAGNYDPIQMCLDSCFNRGVCVSPPANLVIS